MQSAIQEICESADSAVSDAGGAVTVAGTSGYLVCKRIADLTIAVVAAVICLIPMLIIGILVKLDSEGPVIFKQERMGKDGKAFTIYKLRTMKTTAPPDLATNQFNDADQYITRIGAFLRYTGIDELPQLWNVILGDMSLVGYRPLCLTETAINAERAKRGVFLVRPGITGLAQVNGRNDLTDEEKVRFDAEYVRKCSLKVDLLILMKTVATVVVGKGA